MTIKTVKASFDPFDILLNVSILCIYVMTSNYNLDSNTKSSNYINIQFKASITLNYNKIQNITLNYKYFELDNS